MKLQPAKLAEHLRGPLLPVYVVSGDQPLLVEETVDALRAAARAAGVAGREVFFIDRSAPWNDILHAAQSLSLFAERRILEIRMPGGKPGHGAATLVNAIGAAGQDYVLVIITGKLDRDAQASEWLRAAEERGAWIALWPVDAAAFPDWIRARLAKRGLSATPEAVAVLAERTEGNLLAAQQEIEKLALSGERELDVRGVLASVADSTHFDVFQLGEAALAGDAPRTLRVLGSLREDGTEATLVLWSLLRELRNVWGALQGNSGYARGGYGRSSGVADAAARLSRAPAPGPFPRLAERASRADRTIKGQLEGDAWDELALFALELAGRRVLPLVPRNSRISLIAPR